MRRVDPAIDPEGVRAETPGLFGGRPGARAWGGVRDPGGEVLKDAGTGELVSLTRTEEVAEVLLCGGSGYGDPLERPLSAIAEDLADGVISAEAATRDYGAVLRPDGRIDEEASRERRQQARRAAAE